MRNIFFLSSSLIILVACASTPTQQDEKKVEKNTSTSSTLSLLMGPKYSGKKLEKVIENAEQHPLGSSKNPIRVSMPAGQRAYINRLNCANGQTPDYSRDGSFGSGPYGSIMDRYTLKCNNQSDVKIFMDMYHANHIETDPIAGFTIDTSYLSNP